MPDHDSTDDSGRARSVRRSALIHRIQDNESTRVIAVVAPAGYGKSTLLGQWLDQASTPGATITVGPDGNDPAMLLRSITRDLVRQEVLDEGTAAGLDFTSADALTTGVAKLARELGGSGLRTLALDQLEELRTTGSKDTLAALVMALPASITVGMASRSELQIPASALRLNDELVELSADDLAMSVEETRELARIIGVRLDDADLDAVVRHTEGWPAGLYLTFLAVRSGVAPSQAVTVGGDDRFIAQFLKSEVLRKVTPARRDFLLRSSVLDELSGAICDFVLDRNGSDRVLQSLAASNRLVVPVDRRDRMYRYHRLLQEFLLAEAERRDPELLVRLHLRAAEWYESNNAPVDAIRHAIAADDADRAARLVARWAFTVFSEGNVDTVLEWVNWFDRHDHLAQHPEVALLGAAASAEVGDHVAVDRWMAVVDHMGDPSPLGPVAHIVNAQLCRSGVEQCLVDARAAQSELTPSSEWYPPALALEGLALLGIGRTELGYERLELAAQAADRFGAPTAAMFSLATLAMLAREAGDVSRASDWAAQALRRANQPESHQFATSVMAYASGARCVLRQGDPSEARALLARAHARRPMLTVAIPMVATQTLLEMSECHIELGDHAGARQLLRDAAAILGLRSLGVLEDRYRDLVGVVSRMPADSTDAGTLTNAELRLLPLLATHLSFPQIGDRLFISRHTVKTQAMSIYRKLGVSSRSEAVEKATELRLLDI